jgi:hypothetical protein
MKKILFAIGLTIFTIYALETQRAESKKKAESSKWRKLIVEHDRGLAREEAIDRWENDATSDGDEFYA